MMRTGGYLNVINETYKCNDPRKTVLISALMRCHAPRTEKDMLHVLTEHEHQRCDTCKQKCSNGGLPGWTRALWAVTQKHLHEHPHITEKDCEAFVYDLYVRAPVRGFHFEDMALLWLRNHGYTVRLATPEEDCNYAIDIIIFNKWDHTVVAGLQIKPQSYQYVRKDVHLLNLSKNEKAGYPVFYMFYNNDNAWCNELEVLTALWNLQQYNRIY